MSMLYNTIMLAILFGGTYDLFVYVEDGQGEYLGAAILSLVVCLGMVGVRKMSQR